MTGVIALTFLLIGFQAALFLHKASVALIVSKRDRPDTVYVVAPSPSEKIGEEKAEEPVRKASDHKDAMKVVPKGMRKVESFPFDPNTASVSDLMRLGFSQKQAESIDNYRKKGGRFRRSSDFAKSYVVSDSVFKRLEPFISIPKIDINKADSAAFDSLPGIGGWFASRMVSYRESLGGYSFPEQLMDIYHFDREKYEGLKDLITCSKPEAYPLWSLPEDELSKHPYIGKEAAHGIVLFRENTPKEEWTVENIKKNGILPPENADKLGRCHLTNP